MIQNPYLFTVRFKDQNERPDRGPRRRGAAQRGRRPHLELRADRTASRRSSRWRPSTDARSRWARRASCASRTTAETTGRRRDAASFPTIFTFMRDIGFDPQRRTGLIVGQQGKVMRSKDGGKTWRRCCRRPNRIPRAGCSERRRGAGPRRLRSAAARWRRRGESPARTSQGGNSDRRSRVMGVEKRK